MALSGPKGSHTLEMSSSHHIALRDYAYAVCLVSKYQIVLISTGSCTWTFFPSIFQFSCQFWFDNYSWTHCRHQIFFTICLSPIVYTLKKCQCSISVFDSSTAASFIVRIAFPARSGRNRYSIQHTTSFWTGSFPVGSSHCSVYTVSCKVFWHFDLVVAMVDDDAGMSDIFAIFRWVHAWF